MRRHRTRGFTLATEEHLLLRCRLCRSTPNYARKCKSCGESRKQYFTGKPSHRGHTLSQRLEFRADRLRCSQNSEGIPRVLGRGRHASVPDDTCDEQSRISLQCILQATGTPLEQAEKSAIIIQAAFRGHYERMLLNESRGMIQWQRAATRTLEILRKAGASQAEASKAAILIQATYRGYYTRRNIKMKMTTTQLQEEKEDDVIESRDTIPAVAWLDMMYEESGLTQTRANEAASIIQKAYRQYRQKKNNYNTPRIESTRSLVAEAIVKNLHQKVFDEIKNREDIPTEFSNRKDLTKTSEELQRTLKDRLTHARIKEEEYNEQEFVRTEVSEPKLENDDTYSNGAEDQEEAREIEVETEREGTYVRD
ncbi:uncharacterized protein LOC115233004 isoform X3 [Formica exsecta]|uniref:uncharacterized protein LOC115233004 isoform X3 n=1 Tax=Formica exsecta TaxID=72781 RepID=UPI001143DD35|nr:uncharacterized protein LOC115233004 isoform X3 [Formica exsecta]